MQLTPAAQSPPIASVTDEDSSVLVPAVARLVAGSAPSHADRPWHWDTPVDALYRCVPSRVPDIGVAALRGLCLRPS